MWTKGSGQASFAVNVHNGVAKLDMSFSLGHPYDLHRVPQPQHVTVPPPQQPVPEPGPGHVHDVPAAPPVLLKKRRKRKSKCQKERDRHRAQAFQAKSIAEKNDIIFPFSGKLLAVKKSNIFPVEEQNDVDDVISDSDQIAAPAVSSIATLTAVTPPTLPVPAVISSMEGLVLDHWDLGFIIIFSLSKQSLDFPSSTCVLIIL